jgi:hypothetical protein
METVTFRGELAIVWRMLSATPRAISKVRSGRSVTNRSSPYRARVPSRGAKRRRIPATSIRTRALRRSTARGGPASDRRTRSADRSPRYTDPLARYPIETRIPSTRCRCGCRGQGASGLSSFAAPLPMRKGVRSRTKQRPRRCASRVWTTMSNGVAPHPSWSADTAGGGVGGGSRTAAPFACGCLEGGRGAGGLSLPAIEPDPTMHSADRRARRRHALLREPRGARELPRRPRRGERPHWRRFLQPPQRRRGTFFALQVIEANEGRIRVIDHFAGASAQAAFFAGGLARRLPTKPG